MIGFCLFGAGRIGSIHAANISRHENARLVYVVDVDRRPAEALARRHGATVTDGDTALSDPDVQAVLIASSADTHAGLISAAAKAGKAIFCEKPIDLSVTKGRECLQIVKDTGSILAVGFNRRFDPSFDALKRAITSGLVGAVESLHIISRDPAPPPADYLKTSGGLFRDMMIHDFDMARWLLDEEPTQVYSAASCLVDPAIGKAGDVDTAAVTLKTGSGRVCQISNSRRACYGYDQRIEVFGSKGMARAGNQHENTLELMGRDGRVGAKPVRFFLERYQDAYRIEVHAFVESLVERSEYPVSGHDGLQALLLADAAQRSHETGAPVDL